MPAYNLVGFAEFNFSAGGVIVIVIIEGFAEQVLLYTGRIRQLEYRRIVEAYLRGNGVGGNLPHKQDSRHHTWDLFARDPL